MNKTFSLPQLALAGLLALPSLALAKGPGCGSDPITSATVARVLARSAIVQAAERAGDIATIPLEVALLTVLFTYGSEAQMPNPEKTDMAVLAKALEDKQANWKTVASLLKQEKARAEADMDAQGQPDGEMVREISAMGRELQAADAIVADIGSDRAAIRVMDLGHEAAQKVLDRKAALFNFLKSLKN